MSEKNIVEKSYTPTRKRMRSARDTDQSRSRSRSYSPPSSRRSKSRDSENTSQKIRKLEALVEKLSRRSDDVEKSTRVTIRSDCIPEFHPDNPDLTATKWLAKIDQLREVYGWNDISTIYHMQSRLTGMAKSWYHSLTNYNYTWCQWKLLIIKSFPDHNDYAALLRKMLNRKKRSGETMTTYYFEKMELLRGCRISEKEAVSCLIDGLEDTVLQNGACAGRYNTPESLYEEYLSAIKQTSNNDLTRQHTRPGMMSK